MTVVPEQKRLDFLPGKIGRYKVVFELLIYQMADTLTEDYNGGFWEFCELDNGSFYCRPDDSRQKFRCVNMIGESAELSADAVGLFVSVAALSEIANAAYRNGQNNEKLVEDYYKLRDFIYQHTECKNLLRLMD